MARAALVLVLLLGCGPSSTKADGSPASCTSFDCDPIASCSSLSAGQCDALCECFADRWAPSAWSSFAGCMSQCKSIGDTYSTCVVDTSSQQPTFVNPQYISNCDAKRSVCAGYPADACNPVNLALLSSATFDDLVECLGLECGGPAESCVEQTLYCGSPP